MTRKKVVFIIVEGPSDDTALAAIFNKFFDKNKTYVHITHGDITTRNNVNSDHIISTIGNEVSKYAANNHLKSKDFQEIIHIIDTDGAYISDCFIIEDGNVTDTIYYEDSIRVKNRNKIIRRNSQKKGNLNRLCTCNRIWNVPYKAYYMSCNLDHALYNRLNLTDEEKEDLAFKFADDYSNDIPRFIDFITKSSFSVMSSYRESWNFIKTNCESLKRHTNIGLCFQEFANIDNS